MTTDAIELRPILAEDADAVAEFLHSHLNQNVSAAQWRALFDPPWRAEAPNHGFQLRTATGIVGVYAAVYSDREIDGELRHFCNLAAFCVLDSHRLHSLRLLRALTGQKGFEFTDLSPSGNVVALNERLGFVQLDTATMLLANLPAFPRPGVTVTSDPSVIASVLTGQDAQVYTDHRDAQAARHSVCVAGDSYGYVITRKDRRKGLPLFSTVLYAGGDIELVRRAWPQIRAHLLVSQHTLATLVERRVLDLDRGHHLKSPRAKMFKSRAIGADHVDYLYSELTLLEW